MTALDFNALSFDEGLRLVTQQHAGKVLVKQADGPAAPIPAPATVPTPSATPAGGGKLEPASVMDAVSQFMQGPGKWLVGGVGVGGLAGLASSWLEPEHRRRPWSRTLTGMLMGGLGGGLVGLGLNGPGFSTELGKPPLGGVRSPTDTGGKALADSGKIDAAKAELDADQAYRNTKFLKDSPDKSVAAVAGHAPAAIGRYKDNLGNLLSGDEPLTVGSGAEAIAPPIAAVAAHQGARGVYTRIANPAGSAGVRAAKTILRNPRATAAELAHASEVLGRGSLVGSGKLIRIGGRLVPLAAALATGLISMAELQELNGHAEQARQRALKLVRGASE